jgi:putative membrane protein
MLLIVQWIVSAVALTVAAMIAPGVGVTFGAALIASLVLGLLNIFVKPLIVLLTLPLNVITLGLFTLVINAIIIMMVSALVPGFVVRGFGWALLFSIILAIVNMVFYSLAAV